LQWAELKIQLLKERPRLVRIAKYGPGSEKLSNAQVQAESQREAVLPSTQPTNKKKRKHPGRQELPAHLPRVERILTCTPVQCLCQGCGKETAVIGYEESAQLDVEPAKYFVLVTKREKRACRSCARGVTSAPLPPRVIEKSLAK
jgi:transposase